MGQVQRVNFEQSRTAQPEERPREHAGWRSGRPVEDPDKTKAWGFVTAKPSEYLVHVRKGQVRTKTSGQGATCFKLPRDAVSIVPTSLQRLQFCADQVTIERVGVEVTGLAVYRIADPLLAYRVLNFSYPERAQEKLESTLTEMFIGATRRLIANLTIDDCLQKRKAALATELLREVAPVVGGSGHYQDGTQQGWGVVIDTIEIQEVRVLSERVFSAMQAPYRAALDRKAREATAEANRAVSTREAQCEQSTEEARIEARLAVQRKQAEAQRDGVSQKAQNAIHEQQERLREAEAELSTHEIVAEAEERRRELERARWQAEALRRRDEAEIASIEGRTTAAVELASAQAARELAEARARIITAEKLPELAAAVGQKFGEIKITQIGSDGSPFESIAGAVTGILEMVRNH